MPEPVQGDTFESLARKNYGDDAQAWRIAEANPDAVEGALGGLDLAIPEIPGAPVDKIQSVVAGASDEVGLSIKGALFRAWTTIVITRSIDSVDTVSMSAPFEPESPAFRSIFKPFSYYPVVCTVGGAPLFLGTVVGVAPVATPEITTVALSAYSRPGVLGDCTASAASPLEFNKMGLYSIALQLCAPFGIGVILLNDAGPFFEQVSIPIGAKVLPFLTGLAQQRGLVMSSDALGNLVIQTSISAGLPVAVLTEGQSPLLSVSPSFNPQNFYSIITGVEAVDIGTVGSKTFFKNQLLRGVNRPYTFMVTDSELAGAPKAVQAKLGRMVGNMASFTISLSTWRDALGRLWKPNTTMILTAPGAMVYRPYEFLISRVELRASRDQRTAVITLVFLGSYGGFLPVRLPWDI